MSTKARNIAHELKVHAPFTAGGTVIGVAIIAIIVYGHVPHAVSDVLFSICHPAHVLFSALVTTGIYRLHGGTRIWAMIFVGYVGSVGIATISDCLIPYVGELLIGLPHAHPHIGFIEKWYLVNPLALAGIVIACKWPRTKFPHAGHVLLSTSASLFHVTMAVGETVSLLTILAVAVFLFLAVWVPCCTSDIVFPLLFARSARAPAQAVGAEQGQRVNV